VSAEGATHFWHKGNVVGPNVLLATVLPPHAPRLTPTIFGGRRQCRAEPGTAPPTRRGQHATKCYVFPVFSKIWQARFPRNLLYHRMLWLFVSGAHSMSIRPNCMIEKELRHNQLRSLFRKKAAILLPSWVILPLFCQPTGFESDRCQRPTSTRKPGWSPTCTWPLFSRPTPHAPRSTPHQRGQVVRGPSPAGYCQTPTADLSKSRRGPISTNAPTLSVCHRTRQFVRKNQSFSPRSPPPDR